MKLSCVLLIHHVVTVLASLPDELLIFVFSLKISFSQSQLLIADTSAVKLSLVGRMSRELEESRARTDSSEA
jgi:hypothetical protein